MRREAHLPHDDANIEETVQFYGKVLAAILSKQGRLWCVGSSPHLLRLIVTSIGYPEILEQRYTLWYGSSDLVEHERECWVFHSGNQLAIKYQLQAIPATARQATCHLVKCSYGQELDSSKRSITDHLCWFALSQFASVDLMLRIGDIVFLRRWRLGVHATNRNLTMVPIL
jgi:hypothetical protein